MGNLQNMSRGTKVLPKNSANIYVYKTFVQKRHARIA